MHFSSSLKHYLFWPRFSHFIEPHFDRHSALELPLKQILKKRETLMVLHAGPHMLGLMHKFVLHMRVATTPYSNKEWTTKIRPPAPIIPPCTNPRKASWNQGWWTPLHTQVLQGILLYMTWARVISNSAYPAWSTPSSAGIELCDDSHKGSDRTDGALGMRSGNLGAVLLRGL